MVDATAHPHGVLLQHPQARQGLAGVADRRAGALDGLDPVRRGGGDAAQMRHQVQRGAFGGEQPAGGRLDGQQRGARLDARAVLDAVDDAVAAAAQHVVEHHQGQVHAGGHAGFAGHHRRDGRGVRGHGGLGRHVGAVAQVLGQGAPDDLAGLDAFVIGESHQHTPSGWSTVTRPPRRRTVLLKARAGSASG